MLIQVSVEDLRSIAVLSSEDAEKMDSSSVIKTIGFGFISLIAIPFVAIIFMKIQQLTHIYENF